jgi:hypothetical protein
MRRILLLLLALFLVPGIVSAKNVKEAKNVFSVNIPDGWKFNSQEKAWSNANNTGALVLSSVPVGISLQQWANNAAKQNPSTKIYDDKLAAVAAKRLEFTTPDGYKTYLWIAKKGGQGAILTLVHNNVCPDNIPTIKKDLMTSYKWLK